MTLSATFFPPCACWRLSTFVKKKKKTDLTRYTSWVKIHPCFQRRTCRVHVVGEFSPIPVVAELENWRVGMVCADGGLGVNSDEKRDPLLPLNFVQNIGQPASGSSSQLITHRHTYTFYTLPPPPFLFYLCKFCIYICLCVCGVLWFWLGVYNALSLSFQSC